MAEHCCHIMVGVLDHKPRVRRRLQQRDIEQPRRFVAIALIEADQWMLDCGLAQVDGMDAPCRCRTMHGIGKPRRAGAEARADFENGRSSAISAGYMAKSNTFFISAVPCQRISDGAP